MTSIWEELKVGLSTLFLSVPILCTYLVTLAGVVADWEWGKFWGVDSGAWLGFWGTLFSISIALWVALTEVHRHDQERAIDDARREKERVDAAEEKRRTKEEVLLESVENLLESFVTARYKVLRDNSDQNRDEMSRMDRELTAAVYKWVPYGGIDQDSAFAFARRFTRETGTFAGSAFMHDEQEVPAGSGPHALEIALRDAVTDLQSNIASTAHEKLLVVNRHKDILKNIVR